MMGFFHVTFTIRPDTSTTSCRYVYCSLFPQAVRILISTYRRLGGSTSPINTEMIPFVQQAPAFMGFKPRLARA
jgi:hypothetical protein